MTKAGLNVLHSRLYEAYASRHFARSRDEAAALVCRRDIRLQLRTAAGPIVDLSCGRGELVPLPQADGSDAGDIAVDAVTGTQRNLTFAARKAEVAKPAGS